MLACGDIIRREIIGIEHFIQFRILHRRHVPILLIFDSSWSPAGSKDHGDRTVRGPGSLKLAREVPRSILRTLKQVADDATAFRKQLAKGPRFLEDDARGVCCKFFIFLLRLI